MRVYIGCFGSGLGHAMRMLEIAEALKTSHDCVRFSSSGEVATFVEQNSYPCNRLPPADVRYSKSGGFSLGDTLIATPLIFGRLFQQLGNELSYIMRFAPDVVLSDSSLPTVLASRILGIPSVAVLNQLNLTSSIDGDGRVSRLLSMVFSAIICRLWGLAEVLLPDLPPPYTISEKNLWGRGTGKIRYVGLLRLSHGREPDDAAREFVAERRTKVFWQVSGPRDTRAGFLRSAVECARELADDYSFVVAGGDPNSSRIACKIPGGWFYGWCNISGFYFCAGDLVISRAGHGAVSQSLMHSKPSVVVPIPNQPEQLGNAKKVVQLGTSVMLSQGDLSPANVRKALASANLRKHVMEARRLGALVSGFDARSEIVSVVEKAAAG